MCMQHLLSQLGLHDALLVLRGGPLGGLDGHRSRGRGVVVVVVGVGVGVGDGGLEAPARGLICLSGLRLAHHRIALRDAHLAAAPKDLLHRRHRRRRMVEERLHDREDRLDDGRVHLDGREALVHAR